MKGAASMAEGEATRPSGPGRLTEILTVASLPPWTESRFACSGCGKDAASVCLHRRNRPRAWVAMVRSEACTIHRLIDETIAEELADAIAAGDPAWLHLASDGDLAPFFCTRCTRAYCACCRQAAGCAAPPLFRGVNGSAAAASLLSWFRDRECFMRFLDFAARPNAALAAVFTALALLAAATAATVCATSPAFAEEWTVTAEPRTLRSGAVVCALLHGNNFDIQIYADTAFLVVRSDVFTPFSRRAIDANVTFPSGASGQYPLRKQDISEDTIRLYPPTLQDLYAVLDQFNRDGALSVTALGRNVRVDLPDASRQVANLRNCMAQLDLR